MNDQFAVGVATALIAETVKSFGKGVSSFTSAQRKRWELALNTCFTEYINRTFEKTCMIKTLVERTEPVNLFDRFVSPDLCGGSTYRFRINREDSVSADQFVDKLKSDSRYLITATAGAGKSMIMKFIVASMIKYRRNYIPIFVELRAFNEITHQNLEDYLFHTIRALNTNFERDQFDLSLRSGKFCLVLDGFDEVLDSKKDIVSRQIQALSTKYKHCPIVVSSRQEDRFVAWEEFTELSVAPLTMDQCVRLIERIHFSDKAKKDFVLKIKRELWESHKEFLSNPLLASMMLVTFENAYDIPTRKHLFYQKAFNALFEKHDAYKEYKREKKSGLDVDQFEEVFSAFCVISFMDGQVSFDPSSIRTYARSAISMKNASCPPDDFVEDLTKNICIVVQDGLNFVFVHRSFQEYFVARFICKVPPEKGRKLIEAIRERHHEREIFRLIYGLDQDFCERNLLLPCLSNLLSFESRKAEERNIELAHKVCSGIDEHLLDSNDGARNSMVLISAEGDEKSYVDFRTIVNLLASARPDDDQLRKSLQWIGGFFPVGVGPKGKKAKKFREALEKNYHRFGPIRVALEKERKRLLQDIKGRDAFLEGML